MNLGVLEPVHGLAKSDVTCWGKGRWELFTLPPLSACFEAFRLSGRLGWNAAVCVAHSGLGQESLAEVLLYLHYGEKWAVSVFVMWALFPRSH